MSKGSDGRALHRRQALADWLQRARKRANEKGGEALVKDLAGKGLGAVGPAVVQSLLLLGLPAESGPVFALAWLLLSVPSAAAAGAAFGQLRSSDEPRARQVGAWGEAVVATVGADAAFEEFLRQAQSPGSRESLRRSLTAALDVTDREVTNCLARLGCLYAREGRGPDRFFRSCAETLRRMDARDVEGMHRIFDGLGVVLVEDPPTADEYFTFRGQSDHGDRTIGITRGTLGFAGGQPHNPARGHTVAEVPDAGLVLHRLSEATTGMGGDLLEVQWVNLQRFAKVIGR